jgi:calcineurin-like phosphoesterase family protein
MSIPQYGSRALFTPAGKVYMFGDVHNEADKLMDVLDQIEPLLTPDDHIVFCGDLVDRGAQAALTVETLVALAKKYPDQVYFVRGNHDWMLQHYLMGGGNGWMSYLGITLEDFKTHWGLTDILPGTIAAALLAKDFKEVTKRTIAYYETSEILVTHAPLDYSACMMNGLDHYQEQWDEHQVAFNPGFRYFLDKIDYEILWMFTDEAKAIPDFKKFRVCGHQPGHYKNPRIFKDRAFIDTGCGKGSRPLTCMAYPGKQYWQSKS